eukprot:CAMPEP_0184671338 /NCGR_PEP_ID=MMETSP0308-20130426/85436_1 /TAXON_ID=38269 /ORGANISM="Gloeochaete witrockiana, Strain SAG 46.84" /LENGTH=117 /DNA_ID=CAMNT_0027118439 /DNA_START=2102 /DNA_END=2455 /DNA_ORIENTATION=+
MTPLQPPRRPRMIKPVPVILLKPGPGAVQWPGGVWSLLWRFRKSASLEGHRRVQGEGLELFRVIKEAEYVKYAFKGKKLEIPSTPEPGIVGEPSEFFVGMAYPAQYRKSAQSCFRST